MERNHYTQTAESWLRAMSVANPKGKERERVLADLAAMIADRQENSLVSAESAPKRDVRDGPAADSRSGQSLPAVPLVNHRGARPS